MPQTSTPISDILKGFGLTDDEIIDLATEERLLDACKTLRILTDRKWRMTIFDAMEIVKKLREELN